MRWISMTRWKDLKVGRNTDRSFRPSDSVTIDESTFRLLRLIPSLMYSFLKQLSKITGAGIDTTLRSDVDDVFALTLNDFLTCIALETRRASICALVHRWW